MNPIRRLVRATPALLAVASVAAAVWLVFVGVPEPVRPALDAAGTAFETLEGAPVPPAVVVGLLLGGAAMLLFLAVRTGGEEAPTWSAAASNPESADDAETAVVGAEFERRFAAREDASPPWDDDDIEERIRRLAVDTVENRRSGTRSDAVAAVENGTWTDDGRAAAYLGDDDVRASLPVRVWDWLATEPRRRRYARHALSEVASVRGERV